MKARRSITWTASPSSFPTWWFNVRPSNTQPLLRLNVEADDRDTLKAEDRRGAGHDPRRNRSE